MAESDLIGRLCVKLSGREAGRECLIIDEAEGNLVMIDGDVKRRKCNLEHLDISEKILKIKRNAPTSDVQSAMREAGIIVQKRKESKKKSSSRPKKIRKKKEASIRKKEDKKTNESKKQREDSK